MSIKLTTLEKESQNFSLMCSSTHSWHYNFHFDFKFDPQIIYIPAFLIFAYFKIYNLCFYIWRK